jgi:hypothetical protein
LKGDNTVGQLVLEMQMGILAPSGRETAVIPKFNHAIPLAFLTVGSIDLDSGPTLYDLMKIGDDLRRASFRGRVSVWPKTVDIYAYTPRLIEAMLAQKSLYVLIGANMEGANIWATLTIKHATIKQCAPAPGRTIVIQMQFHHKDSSLRFTHFPFFLGMGQGSE